MNPAHSMSLIGRRAILIAAVLISGAAVPACHSAELDTVEPGAVHATESEQLERVMAQLGRLDVALLPQELDASALRRRRQREVAELAGALARSADTLPLALEDGQLPPAEHAEFARLARDLATRARELEWSARESERDNLEARVAAVRASCRACHSRFRAAPALR